MHLKRLLSASSCRSVLSTLAFIALFNANASLATPSTTKGGESLPLQAQTATPNDYVRIEAENRKREAENTALRKRMQELEAAVKEKDAVSAQKSQQIEAMTRRPRVDSKP